MNLLASLAAIVAFIVGGGILVVGLGGVFLLDLLQGDWRVAVVIALVGVLHTADEFFPGWDGHHRRTFGPWLNRLVRRPDQRLTRYDTFTWPVTRREERCTAVLLVAADVTLAILGLWWPLAWAVWAAFRGADLVMHVLGWVWMDRGPGAWTAVLLCGPLALTLSPLIVYYAIAPLAALLIATGAAGSPLTYWWADYRFSRETAG